MLPVGGVDSEAVEHTTVVPGQSPRFIVIIPAWFKYIFTLITHNSVKRKATHSSVLLP